MPEITPVNNDTSVEGPLSSPLMEKQSLDVLHAKNETDPPKKSTNYRRSMDRQNAIEQGLKRKRLSPNGLIAITQLLQEAIHAFNEYSKCQKDDMKAKKKLWEKHFNDKAQKYNEVATEFSSLSKWQGRIGSLAILEPLGAIAFPDSENVKSGFAMAGKLATGYASGFQAEGQQTTLAHQSLDAELECLRDAMRFDMDLSKEERSKIEQAIDAAQSNLLQAMQLSAKAFHSSGG